MKYDVIIIGAGPGGIFSAYELMKNCPDKKVAVFEAGCTKKVERLDLKFQKFQKHCSCILNFS